MSPTLTCNYGLSPCSSTSSLGSCAESTASGSDGESTPSPPKSPYDQPAGGEVNPFTYKEEKVRKKSVYPVVDRQRELLTCADCKFVTESEERFKKHFAEPRHVYFFRNLAYRVS